MKKYRIAATLPVGATVIGPDRTRWTKHQEQFEDCFSVWVDGHTDRCTDLDIDALLRAGGQRVQQSVDLQTEDILTLQLDPGDYVVVNFGWWMEGAGLRLGLDPNPDVAQQLWRVAGWTSNGRHNACLAFDAPEDLLRWTNCLIDPEAGWETRAVEIYIDREDVIRAVTPGQDHPRWDDLYDWSGEFEFVPPPE